MTEYKLVTVIPVNLGNWRNISDKAGVNRFDDWRELYFQEAVIDWSWFPKGSYGRFAIEMKEAGQRDGRLEVMLSWVKAVRDHGRGKFIPLVGSEIVIDEYDPPYARKWEIYETDYFPLPDWEGPVLLYMIGRPKGDTTISVAMWSMAVFELIDDEVA